MSATVCRMYHVKPLLKPEDHVSTNTSMYPMKNLMAEGRRAADSPDTEPCSLARRQTQVLDQIANLKLQIQLLKQVLNEKESWAKSQLTHNSTPTGPAGEGLREELVVKASVTRPPYLLLGLTRLWPGLQLQLTTHLHSSLDALPDHLRVFERLQAPSPPRPGAPPAPSLRIRIVWKHMEHGWADCETVTSVVRHVGLVGEVALGRLLARVMGTPPSLAADDALDTVHRLGHAEPTTAAALLAELAHSLRPPCPWLAPADPADLGRPSVLDLALWSALRAQPQLASPSTLPPALRPWLQHTNQLMGMDG